MMSTARSKNNCMMTYEDFRPEFRTTLEESCAKMHPTDTQKQINIHIRKKTNILISNIETIVCQIDLANKNGEKSLILDLSRFEINITSQQCKIITTALDCINHIHIENVKEANEMVSEINLKWGEDLFIEGLRKYSFALPQLYSQRSYNDFRDKFYGIISGELKGYPDHALSCSTRTLLELTENIAKSAKKEFENGKFCLTMDFKSEVSLARLNGIACALYAVGGILSEKIELIKTYSRHSISRIFCTCSEDNIILNPLVKFFVKYRKSETFTDYKFVSKDREFPCHKLILASRSSFFQTLFEGKFGKGKQSSIPLEGSSKTVEVLLQYLYGEITRVPEDFSINDTFQLSEHANFFWLRLLKNECENHLRNLAKNQSCQALLNMGNEIQDILELAYECKEQALKDQCENYLISQINHENLDSITKLQIDFNFKNLELELCKFKEENALKLEASSKDHSL